MQVTTETEPNLLANKIDHPDVRSGKLTTPYHLYPYWQEPPEKLHPLVETLVNTPMSWLDPKHNWNLEGIWFQNYAPKEEQEGICLNLSFFSDKPPTFRSGFLWSSKKLDITRIFKPEIKLNYFKDKPYRSYGARIETTDVPHFLTETDLQPNNIEPDRLRWLLNTIYIHRFWFRDTYSGEIKGEDFRRFTLDIRVCDSSIYLEDQIKGDQSRLNEVLTGKDYDGICANDQIQELTRRIHWLTQELETLRASSKSRQETAESTYNKKITELVDIKSQVQQLPKPTLTLTP